MFPWRLRRLAPAGAGAARCARGRLRGRPGCFSPAVSLALVRWRSLSPFRCAERVTFRWLGRCASLFLLTLRFPCRWHVPLTPCWCFMACGCAAGWVPGRRRFLVLTASVLDRASPWGSWLYGSALRCGPLVWSGCAAESFMVPVCVQLADRFLAALAGCTPPARSAFNPGVTGPTLHSQPSKRPPPAGQSTPGSGDMHAADRRRR